MGIGFEPVFFVNTPFFDLVPFVIKRFPIRRRHRYIGQERNGENGRARGWRIQHEAKLKQWYATELNALELA